MTKTLTTERLREIASSPSFSANPLSHEVKHMARELLANREAQPVVVTDEMALAFHRALNDGGIGESDLEEIKVGLRGALCNITAPPVPAVPDAIGVQEAKELFNYLMTEEELNATVNGYNACRAAMLAQPVSSGYKLDGGENCWSCGKHFTYVQHSECDGYCPHCGSPVDIDDEEDHQSKVVPAEPTGEMISSAWREATGKCDHETIKRMYKTMLAAAPEGGNG